MSARLLIAALRDLVEGDLGDFVPTTELVQRVLLRADIAMRTTRSVSTQAALFTWGNLVREQYGLS